MTRERDFDRVLEDWFTAGATEMPDRLFETVLDRIDSTPQRRVARTYLRFTDMSRSYRIAAALAAVVVIAVVGFAVLGGSNRSNVGATPSPSASQPSPSASGATPTVSETPPTGFNSVPNCLMADCVGNLVAGSQTSTNFVHPITYVAPTGWANAEDAPGQFNLERAPDFAAESMFRSLNLGPSIYVVPDPVAAVQDAACAVTAQPGTVSIDALASSIASRPGIVASKPANITVGSVTGRMVDVQVAASWTRLCGALDGFGARSKTLVPYIALIGGTITPPPASLYEFGGHRPERQRYVFVDIGGGHTVAIVLIADPQLFDKLVTDAMPIVTSMTFKP